MPSETATKRPRMEPAPSSSKLEEPVVRSSSTLEKRPSAPEKAVTVDPSFMEADDFTLVKKKKPPPPVYVYDADYFELQEEFKIEGMGSFTATTAGKALKFKFSTVEDFRLAISYLNRHNVENHTFLLQEEKEVKVVLRGLPGKISPERVSRELFELGFMPRHVTQLKIQKRPVPLFLVYLPLDEMSKKIYDLQSFKGLKVKVEPFKGRKGPNQCYRCQRWGHSSKACNAVFRCVKCLGTHEYKNCPVSDEVKAVCCNCQQQHPASYRGCVAAKDANRPRQGKSVKPVRKVTPGISYGAALRGETTVGDASPAAIPPAPVAPATVAPVATPTTLTATPMEVETPVSAPEETVCSQVPKPKKKPEAPKKVAVKTPSKKGKKTAAPAAKKPAAPVIPEDDSSSKASSSGSSASSESRSTRSTSVESSISDVSDARSSEYNFKPSEAIEDAVASLIRAVTKKIEESPSSETANLLDTLVSKIQLIYSIIRRQ